MKIIRTLRLPLIAVAIFWAVELWELFFHIDFDSLGVYPRSLYGLIGIFFMPFLHGGLGHLLSNTASFVILSGSLLFFYPRISKQVLWQSYLMTGLGVWLFARSEQVIDGRLIMNIRHIGASGLIYAYAGFLFFMGVFRRDRKSLAISLSIAIIYFGLWQGLVPNQPGISWESHLIGAVVGVILAYAYRKVIPAPEIDEPLSPYLSSEDGYRNIETEYFRYVYKENTEPKE